MFFCVLALLNNAVKEQYSLVENIEETKVKKKKNTELYIKGKL